MTKPHLQKILYVEDEPDIQIITKMALESLGGYELEVCSSGSEAIRKASAFKPDLVLLDVMMPEMDGPTTLKNLQTQGLVEDVPIVFMTAKVQNHEIKHYKDIGAADIIQKPFDPMTLADRVNTIWQQYHAP